MPQAMPAAVNAMAWPITSERMWRCRAPRARRTPISRRRWLTLYDSTP